MPYRMARFEFNVSDKKGPPPPPYFYEYFYEYVIATQIHTGTPVLVPGNNINVLMITFEWDPSKAAANLKKHRVSFEEAKSVFFDEFAVQFFDEDHSSNEERFLMLGMSSGAKLLLVCHCEREQGGIIRIISARKATKRESTFYQGGYA